MKKIILYTVFFCNFHAMKAQDLHAISPINYPKTESKVCEDKSVYYKKFGISISKNKEISYNGKLIYKCDFTAYYEYLIEIFSSDRDYLLVSPLPKNKYGGVATPYNLDRGIVLLFDYTKNKRYYLNLDNIKKIEIPKSFEFAKNKPHAFMIKNIDIDNKEMVLLQGGNKIKEIRIRLYEF